MAEIDRIRLPFREQIDFFRRKLNLPTERWDDIWQAAHDSAFVAAGAMEADLLDDLRQAVDDAIAGGDTLVDFRKKFNAIVQKHGWHGWTGEGTKAGEAWRTKVIYNTNIATSYAAGRWAQLTDPALLKVRPYWQYIHNDSVLHPRPQHKAWGDMRLTLRHDHPFWRTHFPPNGWGCRCRVKAVREPGKGDATTPPAGWDKRDDKGRLPGIDRGWDYAPGANAQTSLTDLVERKLLNLEAEIGAAMAAALRPALLAEQAQAFAAWADALTRPTGALVQVGTLSERVVLRLMERGRMPSSAALAVRDEDVLHTHRESKDSALPWPWYRELPLHVADPRAVLLDKTDPSGALLMVFDISGETGKLVVKIDYEISVRGTDGVKRPRKANILRSGKLLDPKALSDRTSYEVLDGEI